MEKSIKDNFFELLIENDKSKLKDFLILNGKTPKVISPIMFVKEDELEKEK